MEELERKNSIHTMKTDAEELLKKEKSSFLDLFARQSQSPIEIKKRNTSKDPPFATIAAISVIVALGALAFAAYVYIGQRKPAEPVGPKELELPRPILNAEETSAIMIRPGDRTGILESFIKYRGMRLQEGSYRYLPLVVSDVNVEPHIGSPTELFAAFGITPPAEFLDSLSGRWNTYTRGAGDLIFIFEIADRIKTQGSLLRWEDAMVSDFVPIVSGVEPGAYEFKDGIVKNIDTRTARLSQTTDAAIGYSIVLGRYLIVATQESALAETIGRLIAQPSIE